MGVQSGSRRRLKSSIAGRTLLPRACAISYAVTEPLSWLKPGGSGRNHHPLCAALTTRATASAPSGPTTRPCRKRPTLTRADRRPTKGGRQTPAPRGLVGDGPLIHRLQGAPPPRPARLGIALPSQGHALIHQTTQ